MEGDTGTLMWIGIPAHNIVMLVYCIVMAVALLFFIRFKFRRIARSYADTLADLYASPSELPVVLAADFLEADLAYYDNARAALEKVGFSFMADVGMPAFTRSAADPHTFLRLMLSGDGVATAQIFKTSYFLKEKISKRVGGGTYFKDSIQFIVESTDGLFFEYISSSGKTALDTPPEVTHQLSRPLLDAADAYADFRRRYDVFLSETADFIPLPLTNTDAVLASCHRRNTLSVSYRRATGYVSKDEIRRMGGWIFTEILAKMAMADLRKKGLVE